MKRLLLNIFLLSFIASSTAMADFNLSTNFKPKAEPSKAESNLSGEFGVRTNTLVEDVGDVPGNRNFGDLNLKYESNNGKSYKVIDLATRVNDEQLFMFSVKEAKVVFDFDKYKSRLVLGRSILDWSHTDQIWGLGKVNNRVNFDYFEPGQEGLTGVTLEKKFDSGFSVSGFGSVVYVPESNPSIIINSDEKSLECKNPWCNVPASTTEFEGREAAIFYDVNYPEVADVIFRPSVGLKVGYEKEKFAINAFFMHKPENTISVAAEISSNSAVTEIYVEATPQFYNHNVGGGNIEFSFSDNLKLYGSAISITPNNFPDGGQPLIEYTGIKPNKKKEEYLSGGILFSDGDFKSHLGYIARVSEFDRENDILVDLPRWNQAVHLALSKNLTRRLFVGLDYKYDMLTEDRLTMVNTSYRFGPGVIMSLGVNVIGTNPEEESFWSKYENNDSVYSSLKYRF